MTRYHRKSSSPTPTNRNVITFDNGQTVEYPAKLNIRTFQVFWGIPMDETCFSIWLSSFVKTQTMPWDNFHFCLNTYLPEARNQIHNAFLKSNNEWLVMLDSDVIPPPDFASRLIAHEKPMIGGWYCKKDMMNPELRYPVVYDDLETRDGIRYWNIRKQAGEGIEKVDAAGAGCWLMHRDVARAIGENPYNMEHGGEDMELCVKVRNAGFEIWIDWDIACSHVGTALY